MLTANTASELNKIFDANTRVVVVFSSPSWCAPCRKLMPQLEIADEKLKNVTFVKVDPDDADKELVDAWNIMSVPTMVEVENGATVGNVKYGPAHSLISQLA